MQHSYACLIPGPGVLGQVDSGAMEELNENDIGHESSLFINSNMKDVTCSWEYIHL